MTSEADHEPDLDEQLDPAGCLTLTDLEDA